MSDPGAKSARKRKAISHKRRFEIFKRDGFTCQYCGGHPPKCVLHVDHIVPVAEGGDNEDTNLVTACDVCNGGKGARSLSAIPKSLKDRAAEIAEREEQLRGYTEIAKAARLRAEDDAWDVMDMLTSTYGLETIPSDWLASVKRFNAELGMVECACCMDTALAQCFSDHGRTFRYFCGVCWSKIRERDQ